MRKPRRSRAALRLAAALAAASPSLAWAAATEWADAPESSVRIVSAVEATGTGESVPLGLHIRLEEGWKIYWRSPGDAGLPLVADTAGSTNLAALDMRWPAPVQFLEAGDLVTRGYTGEVVLPLEARLAEPGGPLSLRVRADYQICEIVCIPAGVDLSLDLPAGPVQPSDFAQLIARHEARVPRPSEAAGLLSLEAARTGADTILVAARSALPLDVSPADALALVEGPPGVSFRSGAAEISPDRRSLQVEVSVLPPGEDALPAGSEVGVTLVAGPTLAHARVPVSSAPGAPPPRGAEASLAAFLLIALLGGLILNLMPCVLPVLALKVASVADATGMARRAVSGKFLATSAGIVSSFLLLSLAVVTLRSAGHAAGWGFQFQEPGFIAFLAVVILLFAGNLAGLFEVSLPAPLARLVPASGTGTAGAFAQGAFATLLATPCAAPFVGTAVGFALARGPAEIVLIFLGLGVGMALPWLAVAASPRALALLPRPGAWMVTLRRVLALLLLGTAAWLLSVIHGVAGGAATAAVAALGAGAVLALALASRIRPSRLLGAGAATFAVLAILAPDLVPRDARGPLPPGAPGSWTPLAPEAIAELASDRVVFVDVTADWCVTCLLNKGLVLEREAVREALESEDVVRMRGDWTLADPVIAEYLAGFGRYGIPFNAVYGPRTPAGEPLPELLTESAVLSALERAETLAGR